MSKEKRFLHLAKVEMDGLMTIEWISNPDISFTISMEDMAKCMNYDGEAEVLYDEALVLQHSMRVLYRKKVNGRTKADH